MVLNTRFGHMLKLYKQQNAVVRDCIKDELKKRFPGKLIVKELNHIDLSIPEENLPIEIQSTPISRNTIIYAEWEDDIRRQIEQNIMSHGTCWFFYY